MNRLNRFDDYRREVEKISGRFAARRLDQLLSVRRLLLSRYPQDDP